MRKPPVALVVSLLALARATPALDWTDATVFLCDERGTVDPSGRWNTGPIDAAWDVFIHAGEPVDPKTGAADRVEWLNGADHRIRIPLVPGTHTFSFHFESAGRLPILGMNLFLDGRTDRPAISVFGKPASGGPPWPEFRPNGAAATMGPPISEVPGAGSLVHDAGEGGLCDLGSGDLGSGDLGSGHLGSGHLGSGEETFRVTLKDFRIAEPAAAGNVDLVGPAAAAPSGRPDHVGRLTLEVEAYVPRPSEPYLWLQTEAGLTLGAPDRSAEWKARYGSEDVRPPFSFSYDGVPSSRLLPTWRRESRTRKVDENRTASTLTYADPETGLAVRWEGLEYRDARTVEWTVWLENVGAAETLTISDVLGLDLGLRRRSGEEFVLRHWKGTFVRRDDYEPLATWLEPSASVRFAPPGGRPSGRVFPYYNLEASANPGTSRRPGATGDVATTGDVGTPRGIETPGEGMIIVVSWAGQWEARFERDADRGLRVAAGQEATRFRLRPGEKVRTPLIVIQPWKGGDWVDAQNVWRRWMVRHNLPRPGGKLPPVPQLAACSSHQYAEMIHANEENQKMFIDRYLEEGLELDYWWMDAGWYVNEWGWPHTGTWEVDRKRFPNGLRAISDHGRSRGVKTIVWFEPERVAAGTWLAQNHPEWVIGGAGGGLLDLGMPEAWKWLTEHVDGLIRSEGIDLYRQDYNIDPLGAWRSKDAPDRQGITENLYVQGYLAYLDELIRRHPSMLIDSCASGGHRNDLETMRRAVPLLRSDYIFEPVGQQGHTYGLAFWLPFHGTAVSPPGGYDPYTYRSNMCPHNTGCFDLRDRNLDYDLIRRLYAEWKRIAPYYLDDYYPLTPYSLGEDTWLAWQFHRPATQEGVVQAFRRPRSIFCAAELRLRGLDPEARYEVRDLDAAAPTEATGRELMERGLRVEVAGRPGAAVVVYRKK